MDRLTQEVGSKKPDRERKAKAEKEGREGEGNVVAFRGQKKGREEKGSQEKGEEKVGTPVFFLGGGGEKVEKRKGKGREREKWTHHPQLGGREHLVRRASPDGNELSEVRWAVRMGACVGACVRVCE